MYFLSKRKGHPWVPENIYVMPSSGREWCVACKTESAHRTAVKKGKGKGRTRALLTHCKRGHEFTPENTYVIPKGGGRACRTCRNELNKRTQQERKHDPVHQANIRKGRKKWEAKNPNYHKIHGWLYDYQLTPEAYQALLDRQNNKCAICLYDLPEVTHVDHDHSCCDRYRKTCGKCVRGILCNLCNQGLGQFKDDADRLQRASDYIRKHNEIRSLETLIV